MNRLLALLAVGFLGLNMTGCGGSGDLAAPEDLGTPTAEQLAAEKAMVDDAAKTDQ